MLLLKVMGAVGLTENKMALQRWVTAENLLPSSFNTHHQEPIQFRNLLRMM